MARRPCAQQTEEPHKAADIRQKRVGPQSTTCLEPPFVLAGPATALWLIPLETLDLFDHRLLFLTLC